MKIQGKEQDFAIEYIWPRGVTSGPVVSTDVKLGNLTVTNFGVGTATKVANYYPYDGFMGLAFSGGNSGELSTFHCKLCYLLMNGCRK